MSSISDALQIAVDHQRAGRLPEAEQVCRQILAVEPNHADAWHVLGLIANQFGKWQAAAQCIERAVALNPADAEAHSNLGTVFKNQGNLVSAIDSFRKAVELRPDFAEAYCNLGNALKAQGKPDEAVDCYLRAIELKPNVADFHRALGSAYFARRRFDEAKACYGNALVLRPGDSQSHHDLALAAHAQGNLDEAVRHYRQAIEVHPGYAEAHFHLGTGLQGQGKSGEAVACYRRALQLRPDFAEAHNYLGTALNDLGLVDEAQACFHQALKLNPDYAEAHHNRAIAFKDQGQLDEAIRCFRRALEINPDDARVHGNLLYSLQYQHGVEPQTTYEEHRRWNAKYAEPLGRSIQPHSNERSPGRRLRIGYVSPNFRNHCQSLFTVPLLSSHDHAAYEIFCYADVRSPDDMSERLRSYADSWRDISGLADEQVAQLVRQDQIDILVDLTMHMMGSRLLLFARKPAPVQVCWLAYPGTTGLATMDYRLTDPYLDPPGQFDRFYAEKSIRLADTFWCYDPLTCEPPVNKLPALDHGVITFGSLNNFCKTNAVVLKLWARVLHAAEQSRLMLLAYEGLHRQRTMEFLVQEGISAERIVFATPRLRPQYLGLYHQIDIGLDTVPYNGHTTSLDAYWMGVPVITLVGNTVVGRAGLSQLTNLGLPELIAQSADEFVTIAWQLASDVNRLSVLRHSLRQRMQQSPLMDAPRFARNIESAYSAMWRRWCAKVE